MCARVRVGVGGCQCVGVGVSVCGRAWHGSVTVGRVGWVGRVGLDRISPVFFSPPTYLTFQSVCRCLISVVHGRYLRPSFSPGEVIVSMYMYLVISSLSLSLLLHVGERARV